LYKLFAALVMKLPQIHSSYVPFLVRVTTRAAQRTLSRNFNGKRRTPAAQDTFPCLNDFTGLHWFSFAGNFPGSHAKRVPKQN
jgi:hypothetical protein